MPGAGRLGEVGGLTHQCLVPQDRKREGFLCLGGNAEVLMPPQRGTREPIGDHPRQGRVEAAAAAENYLVDAVLGGHEVAIGGGDRGCRQRRGRRGEVGVVQAQLPAALDEARGELASAYSEGYRSCQSNSS